MFFIYITYKIKNNISLIIFNSFYITLNYKNKRESEVGYVRCLGEFGYSSHGVYLSLEEIKELEIERGNEKVVSSIEMFLEQHPDKKDASSIWVTKNAFQCFKQYYLSITYPSIDNESIQKKFPFWETLIYEIDLWDMQFVCKDKYDGYLYCCRF